MHHYIFAFILCFGFLYLSNGYPKAPNYGNDWELTAQNSGENKLTYETVKNRFPRDHVSEKTHIHDTSTTPTKVTISADERVPEFYKVAMRIRPDPSLSDEEVLRTVCRAFAHVLNMSVDAVRISKYEKPSGVLKLYFVHTVPSHPSNLVLLPASEVMPTVSTGKLQDEMEQIEILHFRPMNRNLPNILHKRSGAWELFNNSGMKAWQVAVIIASCLFFFFCVFVIILLLSHKTASPVKMVHECTEERQVVIQPILKPEMSDVNIIQPENKDCYVTETDSEHTPSPCRSPLRMKGKGLLERRGSNASLTLDLNRSQENIHYGTPPKECSTEEYLLSASHRLSKKILHNSLKDVKSIHSEFWEIPMNHPEKVEVPGSGTKNRYKTILPNEATRVHLHTTDDDPVSGYINANYVRGYANEKNAYIATQGPMAHTVNDFWAMVWEQNCPIIVMITKLKEKLKVKCEPYIPDYQGHYKGIDVTVLRIIPRDGYTIRELLLSDGQDSRCVYHFWYTAWPDHKTPDTAKPLLAMAVEVESLRHNSNGSTKGPTIVHCSAGIGRTGCFIAVSIGMQQLLHENMVDILGIVCGLRLNRGGMVQTAEQYEFVHQALSVFEPSPPNRSGE